ncbi:beta-ketoacyl-ACP synthase [Myxacorys almedinensis]|uniref:Beta-ketoacyl-ACP synthase n=1 Tax=Myxacorys almedinensis A TaxID=2690445 RepID=A0A8J8CI19_9CYAN|nr:beta-ketoacyl-ACP synthase [Myxacorys almedinensis]NDJ16026.1 beta-ketoacyl-ACP synthase [Myxacorys almedinensis A]
MDVVVTGIGLISALGHLEQTWTGLVEGRSGIRLCQPFSHLKPHPLALIEAYPTDFLSLTERVLHDALHDANLEPPFPECGVVIGSSRGNQAQWEKLTTNPENLCGWLNTLPNAAAIAVAQHIQTQAMVFAPMAACATGLWAIVRAAELVRRGEVERAIAGAVEAPITPLTLIGFERMGALARTGAYPFGRDREGLVLGEGGAIFVLESADVAKQRGAQVYGQVLGFGLTADGYHVSAPEPGCGSAIAAVQQCLTRSGLAPQDIDYIHAHGTATQLNDQNEAHLIQKLFSPQICVSSTKGSTGHTLGASGALGAAFCLMALRHQVLPPNVGLKQTDFNLAFVRNAQTAQVRNVLCLSFGFGGQNAAIAFQAI